MTLCAFHPYGRQCPNRATVTVTLTGLPAQKVPTCAEHTDDWIDEVAATARPITEPEPSAST